MGIVRKNFLIVSLLITVTFILLLAFLYFVMPIYYNETKKQELRQDFIKTVKSIDGLSKEEAVERIAVSDRRQDNILYVLFDTSGQIVYPVSSADSISSQDQDYLEEADYDEIGAWAEPVQLQGGESLTLQAEYGFNSLSVISQILVTFYPFVLLLVISLAGFVAYFYSRLSNRRIRAISQTARQMQTLDKELACQIKGRDEIATLAQDVNQLYEKLLTSIEELKLENERTAERERQKSEFLRMSSHELKTPLASLLGLVEGMLYNVGDFKNHEKYLQKCQTILQEQSQLVGDVLEATNLDLAMTKSYKTFSLTEEVSRNLEPYQVLAQINDYQFTADLASVTVTADSLYLLKALKNLLDNAFRYTKKGGFIRLTLAEKQFSIENQAEHLLTEEELEQIFQPFYRPDFSRSRKDGGTGIGLFLVQQILDKHGFAYTFEKTDSQTMRFTINFS
ncbi:sensor histidine kinase [Streptococcus pantholopis]|uniref:histidine kinase n=1 Tax=Streptococcus pantholopis TaxID=1811193 RepID=A0A172Q9B1_9STRE|nr:HAMP domain-containing sensor histidine kinase [Streptococcus pantholopis]AND80031.1 histidine kinase [Streptococcus pantholopis]